MSRYLTVARHSFILIRSIIVTYVKFLFRGRKKERSQHPHLQMFIDKKQENGCNLTTLFDLLEGYSCEKLITAPLINGQQTYKLKNELLAYLPELDDSVEILAVPVAIKAFRYFRHFVTIIVDKRANIVEFYDPIGFNLTQYKNDVLWGPKALKKDLLKLSELVSYIQKKYNIETLIENRQMDQTDVNQCALFVYDRIYKRGVKGFSFEKASANSISSSSAFV